MSETESESIDEKVARVEEIITTLQDEDVSLGRAKSLRTEGQELLAELQSDLDVGDADVLEE